MITRMEGIAKLRGIIDAADSDDGDDVSIRGQLVAELEIALATYPSAEVDAIFANSTADDGSVSPEMCALATQRANAGHDGLQRL